MPETRLTLAGNSAPDQGTVKSIEGRSVSIPARKPKGSPARRNIARNAARAVSAKSP
ncbi:MAG: hypothetical protein LBQ12_10895 [Deltaproteobacteria bacterium]|nr:hypothetical protein [Deltaproteobacteria bacterium]